MKIFVSVLLTTSIGFYCNAPYAQIASDGSLPGRNQFDRVEVVQKSPSDNELRQRSLVSKRIYGREEIERFGDGNLADVLSNLAGVTMVGGAPSLSGMDPKYTKILFNGDPAPSGTTMEQINPSLIERIELSRGQSAENSSQSIGGTINIVFKDIPKKSRQSLQYGFSYQNERPTPLATFTPSGKVGDLSYSLPISTSELIQTFHVSTLRAGTDINGDAASAYQEKYWWYRLVYVTLAPKIEYTINDDEKVTSQSYFQLAKRTLRHRFDTTIFSGIPPTENDFDSTTNYNILRTSLLWTKQLSAIDRIDAKIAANRSVTTGNASTSKLLVPQTSNDFNTTDNSNNYTLKYNRIVNRDHVLTTGFDIERKTQHETFDAAYISNVINPLVNQKPFYATSNTDAVFIQDEWAVNNQLALNMGLRSENVTLGAEVPKSLQTTSQNASSSVNSFSLLSPSFFFSYKPSADSKNTLRGGFSKGYKSPSISLMGLNVLISTNYPDVTKSNSVYLPDSAGNSNLKPELSTNLDISYDMNLGKTMSFNIGGFYRDIDNIIAEVTTLKSVYWATAPRWVRESVNLPHAVSYGIETELRASAADLLPAAFVPKKPLNLRLNLNAYGSSVESLPGPDNRMASQYPWTATIGFDYKPMDSLTIGSSMFFSPEFRRQVTQEQTVKQSNLQWVNAFAQYKIDAKSSLRIGVNNLFPSNNRTDSVSDDAQVIMNRTGRQSVTVTFDTQL